jgi:metal-responsive CopG/Arc/MetJ family transcriptional regulator
MAEKTRWEKFEMTLQFNLRIPPEFLKDVDNWRRRQEDLPGRSEAIRRLVELGLKAKEKRSQ